MTVAADRVRTDPRIRRRRNAVVRSKRKRFLLASSLVVAAGISTWLVLFSPLLAVERIRLVGGERTSPVDVARVTRLDERDNVLLVSSEHIERRTETLPWVADAEVDRMLPDTIRIRVRERTPALVLSMGAATWTVDETGYVLEPGESQPGLPILAGVDPGRVTAGARLGGAGVTAGLALWRSLPRSLRTQIVAVFAPTRERLSFSLRDGVVIRYGNASRARVKNRVLLAILERVRDAGIVPAYIDVRVPMSPAVGPALGARKGAPEDPRAPSSRSVHPSSAP